LLNFGSIHCSNQFCTFKGDTEVENFEGKSTSGTDYDEPRNRGVSFVEQFFVERFDKDEHEQVRLHAQKKVQKNESDGPNHFDPNDYKDCRQHLQGDVDDGKQMEISETSNIDGFALEQTRKM
jgi:hypothetical protein